jgi:hypothetical protein
VGVCWVGRGHALPTDFRAKLAPEAGPAAPVPRTQADVDREIVSLKQEARWIKPDAMEGHLAWYGLLAGLALSDSKTLAVKRMDDLLGEKSFVADAIAFGPDEVWLGTNKGLLAYDRKAQFWTRFAVGGNSVEAAVKDLSLSPEGILSVTVEQPDKTTRQFEFNTATDRWVAP